MPGQVDAGIQAVIDGGARIFVAGLGVPRDVIDRLHGANVLVGSMCGKVRHATGAVASGCRLRRRPGHRGRRAHRVRRHDGARPPGGRRGRRPGAGRRRRRPVRRPRPRRLARPRRRRGVDRHPLHRHPGGAGGERLQGGAAGDPRGRHGDLQVLHRQDLPGRAQRLDEPLRGAPGGAAAVPPAGVRLLRRPGSTTSGPPTAPRSTSPGSSCRPARAPGRSTSWSRPATSSAGWSPRPRATIERGVAAMR